MKRLKLSSIYLILVGCLLHILPTWASDTTYLPSELSEQSKVSILVAEPSPLHVYTLYGHAGYRVCDPVYGVDMTFNYGIFDFSDDFLLRFVQGQTDYIVVPQHTEAYMQEYLDRGSQITEIQLALNEKAKQQVWEYLLWNIKEENRTYRYNFFYDNCSTRLVEITAKAMNQDTIVRDDAGNRHKIVSRLALSAQDVEKLAPIRYKGIQYRARYHDSWRTLINQLEARYPWLVLGTDLALGSPTDETMTDRERIFLPHLLVDVLSNSYSLGYQVDMQSGVISDPQIAQGSIVERVINYGEASNKAIPTVWYHILYHPVLIFALICLCALYVAYTSRHLWFAYCLFALSGLAGLLITYITFLSEHPHVSPNYNLIILSPLHILVGFPLMLSRSTRTLSSLYHGFNILMQSFFLISCPPFLYTLLPQTFNPVVYLLSVALLALSISWVRTSASRVYKTA